MEADEAIYAMNKYGYRGVNLIVEFARQNKNRNHSKKEDDVRSKDHKRIDKSRRFLKTSNLGTGAGVGIGTQGNKRRRSKSVIRAPIKERYLEREEDIKGALMQVQRTVSNLVLPKGILFFNPGM